MATLIVGATRGLGSKLAEQLSSRPDSSSQVFGTARSTPKEPISNNILWINNVDVGTEQAGPTIVKGLNGTKVALVIISAGYFALESFDEPKFEDEVTMYKTCAIGPVFIVHHLVKAGLMDRGSKIILVSSESGSITLRHEKEGGGAYAHHASKTALNMIGKLLSLDLKDKGIAVGLVHPGFMRTEMTKGVGFDKFWDEGGAVTPEVAAESLIKWIDTFDISQSGQYWAPRGAADIGTAEETLGPKKDLPVPLQLPW